MRLTMMNFFEIETKDGRAVVINEREWDILVEALAIHFSKE